MIEQRCARVLADFSQFTLTVDEDVQWTAPTDDALVLIDGDTSGTVVSAVQAAVLTGVQVGPVEVCIEAHRSEPGLVEELWEDAVEVSVRCVGKLRVSDMLGDPKLTLVESGGVYRLRICARGRDAGQARGDSGSRAAPVEHYLIQVWPTEDLQPAVTLRATSLQPVKRTAPIYLDQARAAARRIAADIDGSPGARSLSGATGTVHAQWVYRATRRKLFTDFADLSRWTSGSGSRSAAKPSLGFEYGITNDPYSIEKEIFDGLPTAADGRSDARITAFDPPGSVVSEWVWFTGPGWSGTPYLAEPTTVTVSLTQSKQPDGKPQTLVDITHAGVPIEWFEDITTAWMCKLESGARIWRLEE